MGGHELKGGTDALKPGQVTGGGMKSQLIEAGVEWDIIATWARVQPDIEGLLSTGGSDFDAVGK